MPPEDECEREMFVDIAWDGDRLAVPLIQIEAPKTDEETQQAISSRRQSRTPTGTTG
ncbi:MAG: calcium-binding protein [Nodosilinea sp.]